MRGKPANSVDLPPFRLILMYFVSISPNFLIYLIIEVKFCCIMVIGTIPDCMCVLHDRWPATLGVDWWLWLVVAWIFSLVLVVVGGFFPHRSITEDRFWWLWSLFYWRADGRSGWSPMGVGSFLTMEGLIVGNERSPMGKEEKNGYGGILGVVEKWWKNGSCWVLCSMGYNICIGGLVEFFWVLYSIF